jgi:uncharacterized protein
MSSLSEPPEREEPPRMTVFAALGWAFGVTFVLILLQAILIKLKPGSDDDIVRDGFCQVVAYLGGLFLILRVHAPDASIRDFVGLRPTHPLLYPAGLVLGASLWLPADALLTLIEKRWPLSGGGRVAEQVAHASTPRLIMMVAMMAVIGPLVEEALFRGALFRGLRRTHTAGLAIVVTATLFGMVHGAWQIFVPIAIVGLALGVARSASGSSIPGALSHVAFNGMTCALLVATKGREESVHVPDALVWVSLAVAAAMTLAFPFIGARSAKAAAARELDRR